MKRSVRLRAVLCLVATVAVAQLSDIAAFGQTPGQPAPPAQNKKPVAGYTRVNRKTGEPVPVKPYKRRPPAPKPVEVQPYMRDGRPVTGHERRRPNGSQPHSPRSSRLWRGGVWAITVRTCQV